MRLDELIASSEAPYNWFDVDSPGETVLGSGKFPDLEVHNISESAVTAIRWSVIECSVVDEPHKAFIVGRLVADLEDGREVEVGDKICIPRAAVENQADTTKCAACGRSIVSCSQFAIREGQAYCQICAGE